MGNLDDKAQEEGYAGLTDGSALLLPRLDGSQVAIRSVDGEIVLGHWRLPLLRFREDLLLNLRGTAFAVMGLRALMEGGGTRRHRLELLCCCSIGRSPCIFVAILDVDHLCVAGWCRLVLIFVVVGWC